MDSLCVALITLHGLSFVHLFSWYDNPYSRVNKHLRLDKIAIKGFSPEISSFVPFLPTVENPHKSLHGKCPIFTKIQNGGQPT